MARGVHFIRDMNIKALVTTIVLGSSSIALANPMIRDHRTPTHTTTAVPTASAQLSFRGDVRFGDRYDSTRDRRDIRPLPPTYVRPLTWVSLANNAQVNNRTVISVPQSQRQFTKLAIRAEGNGKTSIDKVTIVFGNGQRQVVDLNAKLSVKKQPSLTIDLQGDSRNIERILVVGKSNRNASVDILAI